MLDLDKFLQLLAKIFAYWHGIKMTSPSRSLKCKRDDSHPLSQSKNHCKYSQLDTGRLPAASAHLSPGLCWNEKKDLGNISHRRQETPIKLPT